MSAVYEITNNNIMIGQLVSTSHQYGGVLTSLIQLLVEIHNSFIDKYREIFPKKQSRYSKINTKNNNMYLYRINIEVY